MMDTISEDLITVKADLECDICGRRLSPGMECIKIVGDDAGRHLTNHYCFRCHDLTELCQHHPDDYLNLVDDAKEYCGMDGICDQNTGDCFHCVVIDRWLNITRLKKGTCPGCGYDYAEELTSEPAGSCKDCGRAICTRCSYGHRKTGDRICPACCGMCELDEEDE